MIRPKLAAFLYGVFAVIAFGHSAASNERWRDAHCATADARLDNFGCYSAPSVVLASLAALGWPLYWSWEFFEEIGK